MVIQAAVPPRGRYPGLDLREEQLQQDRQEDYRQRRSGLSLSRINYQLNSVEQITIDQIL